jgi:hypothetical protein
MKQRVFRLIHFARVEPLGGAGNRAAGIKPPCNRGLIPERCCGRNMMRADRGWLKCSLIVAKAALRNLGPRTKGRAGLNQPNQICIDEICVGCWVSVISRIRFALMKFASAVGSV